MKQFINPPNSQNRIDISKDLGFIDKYYRKIFYFIVVGAGTLYAFLNPYFQTGFFNDDAIYVLVARKLWNASTAYPHLGIKPDYPLPGLPLLLAPFAQLVKPHWTYLEWVSLCSTIFSVIFLEKWIRNWLSKGETLSVLTIYAFNPVVAKFSGAMMPGPYYTLFCILSFYLLNELQRNPNNYTPIGLGFVMGWGSLMRPEGFLLSISIVGSLLVTQQRNNLIRRVLAPLACWGIFYVFWFHFQKSTTTEFGHDLRSLFSFWSSNLLSGILFSIKLPQVFLFDTWWLLRYLPASVTNFITTGIILLSLTCLLLGFTSMWKSAPNNRCVLIAVGVFSFTYFMAHVFWHVAAPRYFLALFPFVLIFTMHGGKKTLEWFTKNQYLSRSIFVILILSFVYENANSIYRAYNLPESVCTPAWRTLEWIKNNVKPEEGLSSNFSPSIELYANRNSKQGINATNADLYLYLLMKYRIRYLVRRYEETVSPAVGDTTDPNIRFRRKNRWIVLYPNRFPTVFQDTLERTRICRIEYDPTYLASFEKFIDAVQEFEKGEYEKSFTHVIESLEIYPDLGCANNLLGALYLFQNQTGKAEAAFQKAEKLLPDSTFELLNLATLYYRKGDKNRSLECIKKGLEISTKNGEKTTYLDNVRSLQQKWEVGRATLFIDSPNPSAFDQEDDKEE